MTRLVVYNLHLQRPDGSALLDVPNLTVDRGESVAILGPSGSGKTSFLNCVSGMAPVSSGQVAIDGTNIAKLTDSRRATFRRDHIGILFQFGELLPELTTVQNVALPARLAGVDKAQALRTAMEWLERLELAGLAQRDPVSLSGGEAQRVALARALAHQPAILLADEPTGMLDGAATHAIIELITESCRRSGIGGLIVTHDLAVASHCDRQYTIVDGSLLEATTTLSSHP